MINSFKHYLKQGKVKRKTPDSEEAKSLFLKSTRRLLLLHTFSLDETNSDFIFENAYESIREAVQSLMSKQGYKPYSHEATISFLKEFHNFPEEDIYKFDRYRQLRNDSIYRAIIININDAKDSIIFAEKIIKKIKSIK